MGMRVGGGRQPLAELGILCVKLKATPSPSLVWCYAQPNLPQLPGSTAPPVGWFQVKHTVYRGTLCNHVVKFVLPRIQALKCQRPSAWLQAHHMTPQGWGWLSPRLCLALSESLHHTLLSQARYSAVRCFAENRNAGAGSSRDSHTVAF